MIDKIQNGRVVYSDGEETEQFFLDLVQNYSEDEIRTAIKDDSRYLINNTFSPVRRNLLEWYPFRPDSTVLEVGAGMGSLTKLLCEKASHVTAVEMNAVRADVIRNRCKENKNLTVISEDVLCWNTDERYDYIVMVGVLEYAALFSSSPTPHIDFLEKLKSLLKPSGVLLFAIENQFGLRYWLGSAEDHIGKPFVGIQGFKQPRTARTFSKAELEKMCLDLGLQSRFYYLLPDYKFPTAIFTDESLPTYHDVFNPAYAYGRNSCLTATEREVYRDIIQNEVFPFFANSFLVEASAALPEEYVIRVSGRSEVRNGTRILTVIDNKENVWKIPQVQDAEAHISNCYEYERRLLSRGVKCIPSEFDGKKLRSDMCHEKMANDVFSTALVNGEKQTAFFMIDCLEKALKASSALTTIEKCNPILQELSGWKDERSILEHGYMDMTFYNAFWIDNDLVFFDQEWDFPGLPIKFILYYCIKICYQRAHSIPKLPFSTLCAYIDVTEENAKRYDRLEEKLWESCAGRTGDIYGADGYYNRYGVQTFDDLIENYESQLNNRQAHIELLLQSERDLTAKNEQLQQTTAVIQRELATTQQELAVAQQDLTVAQRDLAVTKQDLTATLQEKRNALGEVQQLRDKENNYLNEISVLQQEKRNALGEVQQLRDKENRYLNEITAIRSSQSWRIGHGFAKFCRFFVPAGSKRAVFARLLLTLVRHPGTFFSCLKPRKIKKFFYMLRKGNTEGIQDLVRMNVTGQWGPPRIETDAPEIVEVDLETAQEKTAADYPVLTIPQWEDPMVSIVIPVYNQFEYTYHCVESILKNSGDVTYEILIANDCSTDLTKEIDDILPGVRCITNEQNLRFLRNCNNAAKHAKGKYILFLNNDTQVQPGWLEPLVTLIESADDIGMVGSKLIYPDGTLQEAGGILWRDGSAWNFGNRQDPAMPQFNYVKETDYISGAAIMLSRSLWEEIGGFSEEFAPAYCEDSDLAFTVRKLGYRVMYQPKSVVVHFEGVSNGTDTSSGQKHYQVVNSQKFFEKWKDVLAEHPENAFNVFQARDRSYKKKTLLMVDHYVPHYDKDAGSRTVFQYLKLFVSLGFNVKFIGDNFFQHEPYTTTLQQMGIEVLYGPECAQNWEQWIRENGEHFDYAFLNRPHIAPKYVEAVRKYTKAKIVYYGHDLAFLREMREYEVTGDKFFKDSSEEWQPKELALMRQADMAYYPSYVEVDAIHEIDPDIRVKAIPAYLFENVSWEGYDFAARKDMMFIGGFGHRPNVDAVKWLANEILPEIVKKLPDIKIHILGSNAPKEVLALAGPNLIIEGFVTDEELERFYRTSRLSIVPLRYGAGIKGKVVEAMRFGTPVVTTSSGAEGIPNAEQAMLVEDDAKAMAEKLVALYSDADRLTDMSRSCITYIQENYSPENAVQVIGPEFDL